MSSRKQQKQLGSICDEMLALVKIQYQEMEKVMVCIDFETNLSLEKPLSVWTGTVHIFVEQRKRLTKKSCVGHDDWNAWCSWW